MNVSTITITPKEAEKKLAAYRSRLDRDTQAQYEAARKAYEKVAQGAKVLDIVPAIREAPRDTKGRPKIAIGRADCQEVRFSWQRYATTASYAADPNRPRDRIVRVDLGSEPRNWLDGYARIPMIPADVRPRYGQRRQWHILWEVEQWSERSTLEPPRDPLLLKHVIGSLYEVLAEWELTEVERAVMRFVL